MRFFLHSGGGKKPAEVTYLSCFFFFFQAEDGIRDVAVTGVQTCALPIYFIEVNPRIQVEHTVTEMVTGIDLVRSQILIAQGHKLHETPLSLPKQESVPLNGAALQCRVTTEDPANNFAPDYGKLSTYRSPAGFGIRLDGGTAYAGAVLAAYYDSLLVKVTAWGAHLPEACQRMDRALREFRIRGVKTNIPFLKNVVNHAKFQAGEVATPFLDEIGRAHV